MHHPPAAVVVLAFLSPSQVVKSILSQGETDRILETCHLTAPSEYACRAHQRRFRGGSDLVVAAVVGPRIWNLIGPTDQHGPTADLCFQLLMESALFVSPCMAGLLLF